MGNRLCKYSEAAVAWTCCPLLKPVAIPACFPGLLQSNGGFLSLLTGGAPRIVSGPGNV